MTVAHVHSICVGAIISDLTRFYEDILLRSPVPFFSSFTAYPFDTPVVG